MLLFRFLYSGAPTFAIHPSRIFVARRCGKAAGMLGAFQGFAVPPGGKKTGGGVANVGAPEYSSNEHLQFLYYGV
jgi:hypothetical protein